MEYLTSLYEKSKHLHHAYFLVGEAEVILENLISFLEKSVGLKTSGNPDFFHGKYLTFNIDHARNLAEAQERKSFAQDSTWRTWRPGRQVEISRKVFIIQAEIITEEAQNALLKVFEEPTSGTHFFIIAPQDILLPTLRSRMQVVNVSTSQVDTQKLSRTRLDILDMKMGERLEKVKEITEAISDEEKTKQDAIAFLNQVESELYQIWEGQTFPNVGHRVSNISHSLEICGQARASLYDRGAPVKIILENVMLSI